MVYIEPDRSPTALKAVTVHDRPTFGCDVPVELEQAVRDMNARVVSFRANITLRRAIIHLRDNRVLFKRVIGYGAEDAVCVGDCVWRFNTKSDAEAHYDHLCGTISQGRS